jgi:phosphatidylserine decarboxylase
MLTKYGTDNIAIMLLSALILIVIAFLIAKPWANYIFIPAGIILIIFTFWFFRDPQRITPKEAKKDNSLIIAPSDGKVIQIIDAEEKEFMKAKVKQISVFLSPLDVHVNRIPISGVIKYFKYNPGDYLIAYHPKASELNEQTHIGIENEHGKLFFKQIVGILARRLVWDIKEGDTVVVGNKFGMMKFGSRIDMLLMPETEIYIKPGDKLIAGETIIGKLKSK